MQITFVLSLHVNAFGQQHLTTLQSCNHQQENLLNIRATIIGNNYRSEKLRRRIILRGNQKDFNYRVHSPLDCTAYDVHT